MNTSTPPVEEEPRVISSLSRPWYSLDADLTELIWTPSTMNSEQNFATNHLLFACYTAILQTYHLLVEYIKQEAVKRNLQSGCNIATASF